MFYAGDRQSIPVCSIYDSTWCPCNLAVSLIDTLVAGTRNHIDLLCADIWGLIRDISMAIYTSRSRRTTLRHHVAAMRRVDAWYCARCIDGNTQMPCLTWWRESESCVVSKWHAHTYCSLAWLLCNRACSFVLVACVFTIGRLTSGSTTWSMLYIWRSGSRSRYLVMSNMYDWAVWARARENLYLR